MMKKTEKEKFGFTQFGYIWGLKGNTYPVKDELKAMGFRFSKTFLWTLVAADAPTDLPEGITPFKIEWDKISYISPATGEERLVSDKEITEYLDSLRYEVSDETSFEGEIGERIERTVKVLSIKEIHSNYGTSFLHQFETEDGNLLTWFTQSLKQNFEEGEECLIRATVKEHKVFRGKKQTVVSRVLRRS